MHYRVTRPGIYSNKTPGHANPGARQGYYCDAESVAEARETIRARQGFAPSERLDVQDWSGGKAHGRLLSDVGAIVSTSFHG